MHRGHDDGALLGWFEFMLFCHLLDLLGAVLVDVGVDFITIDVCVCVESSSRAR